MTMQGKKNQIKKGASMPPNSLSLVAGVARNTLASFLQTGIALPMIMPQPMLLATPRAKGRDAF